jgi:hypothetical protein
MSIGASSDEGDMMGTVKNGGRKFFTAPSQGGGSLVTVMIKLINYIDYIVFFVFRLFLRYLESCLKIN